MHAELAFRQALREFFFLELRGTNDALDCERS